MPRYDKYDPMVGGFRASAASNCPENEFDVLIGAKLNASGAMVTGSTAGNTAFCGVVIRDRTKRRAGDRQDIMTFGEVVWDSDETPLVAGTDYFLSATGALVTTPPAAGQVGYKVGHTVEAWRLVVRFQRVTTPAA